MKSIFDPSVADELAARIRSLTPETTPKWGKMDVAQMMAHSHVTFEMALPERASSPFKKTTGLKRWLMRTLIKPLVVGEKPYKKNGMTAPEFRIAGQREFDTEQSRLLESLALVGTKGRDYFEQLESPSFGPMTAEEWSRTLYKHLDHHLQQFGV